ncbi:MAG: exonuclease SbcCD subunit D [Myxococcota bacterium]
MRLLHLTDTHLGAWMNVRGAPDDWSRAHDHHRALVWALELAEALDEDAIVHTGDVFDRSKPPPQWAQAAADALVVAAAARPVVVLSGNHDRQGFKRTLPMGVPGLHVVDKPAQVQLHTRSGAVRLGCVPYYRSRKGWKFGAHKALNGGVDLMLVHQAFDGVEVPGLTFRVANQGDTVGAEHLHGLPSPAAILCGHIHPRQVVPCGGVPVVHPGCLTHTAFRDRAHPQGVAVWTLEQEPRWRFVDRPARAMRVVATEADVRGLVPGSLVRLGSPALEEQVLNAGGWIAGPVGGPTQARAQTVVSRARGPRQLRMFE